MASSVRIDYNVTGMVPRILRRLTAALGILLLVSSSNADALGIHRCAHHDQLPSSDAAQHDHHDHSSEPAENSDAHGCTCVGTCSTTSAAPAPSIKTTVDVVSTTFVPVTQPPAQVAPQPVAFLLPYSTAPPVAL